MPYSSCCRTQNEPMETTRIAHDLSNNGFDRVIQLAIAQESLRQLQESLKDLPEIETEYMEAIRGLQQSDSSILKERMRKLAEEMMELRREMESAPGGIEKLKNDACLKESKSCRGWTDIFRSPCSRRSTPTPKGMDTPRALMHRRPRSEARRTFWIASMATARELRPMGISLPRRSETCHFSSRDLAIGRWGDAGVVFEAERSLEQ